MGYPRDWRIRLGVGESRLRWNLRYKLFKKRGIRKPRELRLQLILARTSKTPDPKSGTREIQITPWKLGGPHTAQEGGTIKLGNPGFPGGGEP